MAPNGVTLVVFVLVEPLQTDLVQRTDGKCVLDSRGVWCAGVLKRHLEEVLNQAGVMVGPVDVAVEGF